MRSAAIAPAAEKILDGNWWLAASHRERLGYMEGDNDCSVFELHGRAIGWDAFTIYEQFVTSFYAADANHRARSAFDALRRADSQISAEHLRQDGVDLDLPSEPHGDYDGLFWRESFDRERLGFIEGYLQCYDRTAGKHRAAFSKSFPEYVSLLNAWYHLKDVERDVDPKIENVKIADALFRFRDRKGFAHLR